MLEVEESLALKPSAVPASNKRGKALMSPTLYENTGHLMVVSANDNAEHTAIWQAPEQRQRSSREHTGDSRAELRSSREQQREQALDPLIFRLALRLLAG